MRENLWRPFKVIILIGTAFSLVIRLIFLPGYSHNLQKGDGRIQVESGFSDIFLPNSQVSRRFPRFHLKNRRTFTLFTNAVLLVIVVIWLTVRTNWSHGSDFGLKTWTRSISFASDRFGSGSFKARSRNLSCIFCIISIMRGYSPREAIRSWKRHTCPRTWCTQRSRDGEACVPKSPRKRHLPRRKPRGTCKVAVW